MESIPSAQDDNINFRQKRLVHLLKFFEKIDLDKIATDPEKEKDFIQKMSFEKFQEWLLRINGILRDIPIKKRNLIKDGEFVRIFNSEREEVSYTPPVNSLKVPLLNSSFEAYKRMEDKGRKTDAALMLGSTINAVHPFPDGNGRTARFISMMLASSKDEVVFYEPNPSDIQPFIEFYIYNVKHKLKATEAGNWGGINIPTSEKLSGEEKKDFGYILENDSETFVTACRIYLKKKGGMDVFLAGRDKIRNSAQAFFHDQRNNIKDLISTYNDLKKEYVQTLIEVFEKPEKFHLKDMPDIYKLFSPEFKGMLGDKTILDLFYMANAGGVEKGRSLNSILNEE